MSAACHGHALPQNNKSNFIPSSAEETSRPQCVVKKATILMRLAANSVCKPNANWNLHLRNSRKFFAPKAKLAFSQIMSGFGEEREGIWDEYDWERFLRQQDQRTEKYMELLEKYIDDPQRDEIIAREMGWTQSLGDGDWSAEVDALLDEDWRSTADEDSKTDNQKLTEGFEDHILYRAAFGLTVWIDKLFDQNASLQNEPAAIKLATHAALASAKLAAALSDDDVDELGMTIAYLKRALKAITVSLDSAAKLLSEKLIAARQYSVLQQRLFQVRDGIIT